MISRRSRRRARTSRGAPIPTSSCSMSPARSRRCWRRVSTSPLGRTPRQRDPPTCWRKCATAGIPIGGCTARSFPAKKIVDMVTVNPAKAFRIQKETGSLAEGKLADVLIVRQQHDDPWESLVAARVQDIELLIQDGSPIFGAAAYEELFSGRGVQYSKVSVHGRGMIVKGDPRGSWRRSARPSVSARFLTSFRWTPSFHAGADGKCLPRRFSTGQTRSSTSRATRARGYSS